MCYGTSDQEKAKQDHQATTGHAASHGHLAEQEKAEQEKQAILDSELIRLFIDCGLELDNRELKTARMVLEKATD